MIVLEEGEWAVKKANFYAKKPFFVEHYHTLGEIKPTMWAMSETTCTYCGEEIPEHIVILRDVLNSWAGEVKKDKRNTKSPYEPRKLPGIK